MEQSGATAGFHSGNFPRHLPASILPKSVSILSSQPEYMMLLRISLTCLAFLFVTDECVIARPQKLRQGENLALGKPVRFGNPPNYKLTSKGDSDTLDLTDGKLAPCKDDRLWFHSASVGFSYIGLEQMAIDLEKVQPIDEVAIRFQGGASQAHINTPVWIDVVVSDDGETWRKVASYSIFNKGDHRRFEVPPCNGKAWVHTFRFKSLKTRARHVGISFYGAGLSVSDELWVFRGKHDLRSVSTSELPVVSFCVDKPLVHFHKPTIYFATNQITPNPVGLAVPRGATPGLAKLTFDLPMGLRLLTGAYDLAEQAKTQEQIVVEGEEYTRYILKKKYQKSVKPFLRLYLTGDWEPGHRGLLRYRLSTQGEPGAWHTQSIESLHVPPTPQPKRLQAGLGWFDFKETLAWPDSLGTFANLGLNNVSIFPRHHSEEDASTWNALKSFREAGYKVMVVDSPFHHLIDNANGETAFFMHTKEGQVIKKYNLSYRGPLYQNELDRLARQAALAKADYLIYDIELWGAKGPVEAKRCVDCQADFAKGGYSDWSTWMLDKGEEIATDLSSAVRAALEKRVDLGCYDFRPGHNFSNVWPFDRLYPKQINHSQVSTYTTLEPYHIELIGDEVRKDRLQLPKSDQMPWISPGDAGSFSGEVFRYALLEAFANGARGVLFWSGRVWDTESLAAYARVIRNVGPVEDIILDGEPIAKIRSNPKTRIRGMRHEGSMFLLVSDYTGRLAEEMVKITLPVQVKSNVVDLETGRTLAQISPLRTTFELNFPVGLVRTLHIVPSGGGRRSVDEQEETK